MPPQDPRLCPDLETALPGDRQHGTTSVCEAPEPWSIQFGGSTQEWHDVHVVARAADVRGREVIDVEWYIEGLAWTGSYVAERGKMRKRWLGDRGGRQPHGRPVPPLQIPPALRG
jgi:hypothetical protein